MTEVEKLINEVLEASEEQDTGCFLATTAPKLARALRASLRTLNYVSSDECRATHKLTCACYRDSAEKSLARIEQIVKGEE